MITTATDSSVSVEDEIELRWGKKTRSPQAYPKDGPPENLILPFQDEADGRGPETSPLVWTRTGRRGRMKAPKRSEGKLLIPGWLIELDKDSLEHVRIIKETLKSIKDVHADVSFECDFMSRLIQDSLGLPIEEAEVETILRKSPYSSQLGVNFTHFMYALADPNLIGIDHMPYRVKSKGTGPDTGYTDREKFFFSAILLCQMYELIEQTRSLFEGQIPQDESTMNLQRELRGHGISRIGIKDPKKAEWDKYDPLLPKASPYLTPCHFVTTRRTSKKTQHDHFIIKPPPEGDGVIVLQENRARIQQALKHIFMSKPAHDCVCILPDIEYLLRFTQPIAKTLEEIARDKPKKKPFVNYFVRDMQKITKELKYIFRPVMLPEQFKDHRHLITDSMAHEIRGFLDRIHAAHWENLKDERVQFLNRVWHGMECAHIPNRIVQNALYLSFTALLPYNPHFTSLRTPSVFIRRPHQRMFPINFL